MRTFLVMNHQSLNTVGFSNPCIDGLSCDIYLYVYIKQEYILKRYSIKLKKTYNIDIWSQVDLIRQTRHCKFKC